MSQRNQILSLTTDKEMRLSRSFNFIGLWFTSHRKYLQLLCPLQHPPSCWTWPWLCESRGASITHPLHIQIFTQAYLGASLSRPMYRVSSTSSNKNIPWCFYRNLANKRRKPMHAHKAYFERGGGAVCRTPAFLHI